jgi:hypothetical protein
VIEAVVFDWGGTLTPWLAMDPHASWRAYAGALHPDDTDREPRPRSGSTKPTSPGGPTPATGIGPSPSHRSSQTPC